MLEFLSRRLAAALVTLALATVVVFAVVEVLPGGPALVLLGDAGGDSVGRLRRLEAWRAGRLGRHGFYPDRHFRAEFLVRHRAGAAVRGDLAALPGRRISRLA